MNKKQVMLPFLPGYMWNGSSIVSTGATLPASQVINRENGEVRYYVKPVGWPCSAYIRHEGIVSWLELNS